MKYCLLFAIVIGLFSCTKTGTPEKAVEVPPVLDTTVSKILYTGQFIAGPYGNAMGSVKILDSIGVLSLRIDGFSVNSGPDLKIYLSKEQQPLNFLRLGSLKGLSGDQQYSIINRPDFMEYRYVLIHCEKYNHLFGSALLLKR
ncbi:MAG: DM13 domain-containing protein [Chitinophagaceae bacterium]|nr:DM13 domain-containing protein [Chitinophagaceae bacterium]